MASPKPAPACFASTDSTHSPAQLKNGEYIVAINVCFWETANLPLPKHFAQSEK